MTWDEIVEQSQNKSANEINDIASVLEQSIRSTLSRLLMDTDAEHPMNCRIQFSEYLDCYYNDCLITAIYQDPTGGTINCYVVNGEEYKELDEFTWNTQLVILNEIWKLNYDK